MLNKEEAIQLKGQVVRTVESALKTVPPVSDELEDTGRNELRVGNKNIRAAPGLFFFDQLTPGLT